MIITYCIAIIFVLFDWTPDGLCLNLNTGNQDITCRSVLKRGLRIGPGVLKETTDLKCRIVHGTKSSREKDCVLTIRNTTRHYVHLANRNCDISNVTYFGSILDCVVSDERTSHRFYGTSIRFGESKKIPSKYIVHFIDSVMGNSSILNGFNTRRLRRGPDARFWNVFICSKRFNANIQAKNNERSRGVKNVFHKLVQREKRHILGHTNNATAFRGYLQPNSTVISQVTPPRRTPIFPVTSQNVTVASRSASELLESCPRSVLVKNSTVFVTPTIAGTPHVESSVATSKLTSVSQVSATIDALLLRNHTRFAQTSNAGSAATLALNANATRTVAQEKTSTNYGTYIYSDSLVSIVSTRKDSAFIANLGCATVVEHFSTESAHVSRNVCGTATSSRPTPRDHSTKPKALYIGLIAGGAVIFSIIIGVALFRCVRRYRRIQGLRRKAKHISYFNRFDCSSPWDEPDRFGGSKLSVFTLKNSKFDIDWESTHDTK